jgi:hypothetical protein
VTTSGPSQGCPAFIRSAGFGKSLLPASWCARCLLTPSNWAMSTSLRRPLRVTGLEPNDTLLQETEGPVGCKNSNRARDQVFLRVRSTCSASAATIGIQAVQRTRHLFSQHCQATPDPMVHIRMKPSPDSGGPKGNPSLSAIARRRCSAPKPAGGRSLLANPSSLALHRVRAFGSSGDPPLLSRVTEIDRRYRATYFPQPFE